MAGRAPWLKEVRVHAHVWVGGGGGRAVGVEVQVLQPDTGSAEPTSHRTAAAGSTPYPETRWRQSPIGVVLDWERRSTGRGGLREEIVGDPTVAVHGGGGSAAGDESTLQGAVVSISKQISQ
jgi:hypothetical protein